ncbi:MAG: PAS domain S-box protein [Opitutus sp.]
MKLRTKLIGSFGLVAALMLGISGVAVWQVQELSSALYEIGVVRLPSIEGLDLMGEAMQALRPRRASPTGERFGDPTPGANRTRTVESWLLFDRGWAIYEPLPQTPEEAAVWKQFVDAVKIWRSTDEPNGRAVTATASSDSTTPASAEPSEIILQRRAEAFARAASLIIQLKAINHQIVESAQQRSISSQQDVARWRATIIWVGGAGVFFAATFGLLVGRVISRPLSKVAQALTEISSGNLKVKVATNSNDELGEIGRALNSMVEDLKTSEARLAVLSDNLPESLIYQVVREASGAMRFLYVSGAVERLHGFTATAVLRDSSLLYNQVLDEDRGRVLELEEQSARELKPFNVTVRLRRADGELRWMHLSSAPRLLPDNRVVWDGIETDVTERKTAEARLQESEARFRMIFDHSLDAIGVSLDEKLIFANPPFAGFFGYESSNEVIGRPIFDFIAEGSRAIVEDRIARRAKGETPSPAFELRGRRRDGTEFEMEVHASPFVVNGSNYTIAINRNITARKRREAELQQANRALNTIRACHELLIHATTEDALLKAICEVVVTSGQYRGAWVGLTDPTAGSSIWPAAYAGISEADFQRVSLSWASALSATGPTATALRTGQPTLCRDVQRTPGAAHWQAEFVRFGINSAFILPLIEEGKVVGSLSIYSAETDGFDESAVTLLTRLSEELAFGLQTLRARRHHEEAEEEVRRLLREAESGRSALLSILEDQTSTEVALQRSEERFRSAMFNSAIGMALSHANGECFEVNPALCRIVGYSREELVGRDFARITHPDDQPTSTVQLDELLAGTNATVELEQRYIHRDGAVVWVQLNMSVVRDPTGQPLHTISQIQDISERRRTAAAREDILKRLQLALKTGRLGTFRRNVITGEGTWDDQAFALIGRAVSQRAPNLEEFLDIIHPEDREHVRSAMSTAMTLQREVSYSFRLVRADGVLRHFTTHAMIEPDSEGAHGWVTGVFNDVSDIIEAEQNLKLSAQRLQLALDTSKLGVWQYDFKTDQTNWDDRMFEMYHVERATSQSLSHADFLAKIIPEDRTAVERAWENMMAGTGEYRVRFRILTETAETRYIDANAVLQLDELNAPKTVVGVNSDVTDIIQATAESERLREQLQQAQKMETLGTLAAGVAHDFNNLLTGINGFVDLAASSLPPGHEAGDLLKQALRGAMNARDLVRRILDFSRGRGNQVRTRIDLGELVRETAPLISAALPNQVSLSVVAGDKLPAVLGDSGQLQQLLMNLCINGSHAINGRSGTVRATVSERTFAATDAAPASMAGAIGKYVCLSVSDNGSGMTEATRKRLFEPFFTTKRAGVGTGLGLSIVRDIVTAHRGVIDVETELGRGTTFSIYLPALVATVADADDKPAELADRGRGQRIMVVDDDAAIGMVLRLSLQKIGYRPEVYTSPMDAWKRFANGPDEFDLLMVDQNMPELTGTKFIQQARRIAPQLPMMVMSGRFERSELSTNGDMPGVFALKKPFEIVDLISAVHQSLHHSTNGTKGAPGLL